MLDEQEAIARQTASLTTEKGATFMDRIAKRLGQIRETISDHLAKMPALANPPKADLSREFSREFSR